MASLVGWENVIALSIYWTRLNVNLRFLWFLRFRSGSWIVVRYLRLCTCIFHGDEFSMLGDWFGERLSAALFWRARMSFSPHLVTGCRRRDALCTLHPLTLCARPLLIWGGIIIIKDIQWIPRYLYYTPCTEFVVDRCSRPKPRCLCELSVAQRRTLNNVKPTHPARERLALSDPDFALMPFGHFRVTIFISFTTLLWGRRLEPR